MAATNLGLPKAPPPVLAPRRKTRQIMVGKVAVGGDAPISVQSMCTTPTTDVNATLQQIAELTASGCDIVRVAVPSQDDADRLQLIARFVMQNDANGGDVWFHFHTLRLRLERGLARPHGDVQQAAIRRGASG
ncbi:MAG: hypothetical protein RL096_443, partial [Actinomycetota bacterium]